VGCCDQRVCRMASPVNRRVTKAHRRIAGMRPGIYSAETALPRPDTTTLTFLLPGKKRGVVEGWMSEWAAADCSRPE